MGILSKTMLKATVAKYRRDPRVAEVCKEYNLTIEEAVEDFIEDLEWSTFHTYEELENLNIIQLSATLKTKNDIRDYRHVSKVSAEYKEYVRCTLPPYLDENGEIDQKKVDVLLKEKKDFLREAETKAPYVAVNSERENNGLIKLGVDQYSEVKLVELSNLAILYGNCERLYVSEEYKIIIPCFLSTTIEYNEPGGFLNSLEGPLYNEKYFIENKKLIEMVKKEIQVILDEHNLDLNNTYKFYKQFFFGDNDEFAKLTALRDTINYKSKYMEDQFKRSLPDEYGYLDEYIVYPVESCVNLISGNRSSEMHQRNDRIEELIKYGYDEIVEEIKCMNQSEV